MLGLLLGGVIAVTSASGKIVIDGGIAEEAWRKAAVVTAFYETYPGENLEPKVQTQAFLTYDRENLYIAFKCFDPHPEQIRANYADRDASGGDDRVGVYLDTFHDQRRAYYFAVTALGNQSDGIYTETIGLDSTWDTLWDSAGRRTDFGCEVEMAIPFKSLRFSSSDVQEWGAS